MCDIFVGLCWAFEAALIILDRHLGRPAIQADISLHRGIADDHLQALIEVARKRQAEPIDLDEREVSYITPRRSGREWTGLGGPAQQFGGRLCVGPRGRGVAGPLELNVRRWRTTSQADDCRRLAWTSNRQLRGHGGRGDDRWAVQGGTGRLALCATVARGRPGDSAGVSLRDTLLPQGMPMRCVSLPKGATRCWSFARHRPARGSMGGEGESDRARTWGLAIVSGKK